MTKRNLLRRAAALVLFALPGACDGHMSSLDDERAGAGDASDSEARRLFDASILPLLEARCAGCHGDDFLSPDPDVYSSVMSTPGLVVAEAGSGSLLTVGDHAGAQLWSEPELVLLRQWLELEVAEARRQDDDAVGDEPQGTLEVGPVPLEDGMMRLPLDPMGLTGATLGVRTTNELGVVYFSAFEIVTAAAGLRLVHPTWTTWIDGTPTADPDDRFSDLEIVLGPYSRKTVRENTFMHAELPEGGQVSVAFEVAEVSEP